MLRFNLTAFVRGATGLGTALSLHVATAAELTVVVDHLKAKIGNVRAAVFNDSEKFPKAMLHGQKLEAAGSVVTLVFKDLPPGRYAVSAYQDLNLNDKLDTNAFGMPKEPYGFSRNARGRFGPPSFEDASFELGSEPKTIRTRVDRSSCTSSAKKLRFLQKAP